MKYQIFLRGKWRTLKADALVRKEYIAIPSDSTLSMDVEDDGDNLATAHKDIGSPTEFDVSTPSEWWKYRSID